MKLRRFLWTGFIFFPLLLNAQSLDQLLASQNYASAFEEILSLTRQDISIIENYPSILIYFDRKQHPDSYDFFLKKTNQLLEDKFYKEALRIYKILSFYEKNDADLFENYRKAYVFYTNSILKIKKALSYYKTGDITLTRKQLRDIEREVPKDSQLHEMVLLGEKEVQKKIYQDYVVPGLERIDNLIDQAQFNEARGSLAVLRRLMPEDLYSKTAEKIKIAEKSYYFQKAEESFQRKEYEEPVIYLRLLTDQYPGDTEIEKKMAFYREAKLKAALQAEAYNNLKQGDFYFEKKDYERALFYYKNYLDLVKEDPEIQKRILQIEKILEEERRRKFFYEQYNKGVNLLKTQQYEQALAVLEKIQDYPYEKEKLTPMINSIRKELEQIRKENESENLAKNYREQGNQSFASKQYKEALDSYVLALSLLEEVRGREPLKRELQALVNRTQSVIKEVERKKAEERLRKIEQGINRGRQEYILGNYEKSLIYFQDVLELDSGNLIVKDYIDLATEAQKTTSLGIISTRDPFYSLFIALKSEGEKFQQEGIRELNSGRREKGKELLEEAVNKWQTIKRAYPYNEEARKNIRSIFKYLDPEGFKRSIQEDLDKALELAQRGNKPAANKIVKEIYDEIPNFPRIKYYLEQTTPEQQRRILTLEERKTVQVQYNQALGFFTKREYQDALKTTERILGDYKNAVDPVMDDTKNLYLRIKRNLEAENLKSLDLSMTQIVERTKYYRQALDFYQKQEYRKTIEAAQKALRIDPAYTSAQSLLEAARKRLNL